ncbi:Uncharacterised protein [Starkeya nomas]|uniref:Ner winged helix-turn-helix DNA-binding domain-containing protein n=1 Tax=Starkeya nomas TaxID=2666134 RepID=A0A5S9ND87_9HYPH|nr:helix-turn-helix domain-containing protein [Starkeya nomas]CAA0088210.1 Uncharacterised protein [Starkeya nomas]
MAIREANGRWTVTVLSNGDWHPEEIKAAVRMRGSSFEKLSRDNRLSEGACRVAARRPHFEGERAIAAFLDLSPRKIWPSRYRKNGSRIPGHRNRRDVRSGEAACQRLIERAA